MKIKGITEIQLRAALASAGSAHYEKNLKFRSEPKRKGNFINLTLGVHNARSPGAARSNTGRRINAACWHAHRDVMRAIFSITPNAILHTMLATYRGSNGFEHEFAATGLTNIGSMMKPMQRRHACACPDSEFTED